MQDQALFEEQLNRERRLHAEGIERYLRTVQAAEASSRGSETGYSMKLMKAAVAEVAKAIQRECVKKEAGPGGAVRSLLREVNPNIAAFLGLKRLFDNFQRPMKVTAVALQIGQAIEDELRFNRFHDQYPEYFEQILQDFKRKGTQSYKLIHRILTSHAQRKDVQWNSWETAEKLQVGAKVLHAICISTDLCTRELVRKGRTEVQMLIPTQQALEFCTKYLKLNAGLHPDKGPLVYPPDNWVSNTQGGYWTPQMRTLNPMVKTKNALALERLRNPPEPVLKALNTLQETAFEINPKVFSILKEAWQKDIEIGLPRFSPYPIPQCPFPPDKKSGDMAPEELKIFRAWKFQATQTHSNNKERISKCFGVTKCLQMAHDMAQYNAFWFVWQCDFRGRMYPSTSGLSPQGADYNKALLRFHTGKPLGETGKTWFLIHGANTYGIDKVSFGDRIKWVSEHTDRILRFAENPFGDREFWAAADKPWQFLAWALEFQEFHATGDTFISKIAIGLDGTCNGLQNYSAMLRDHVGGRAVNLTKSDVPSDIYTEVAQVLTRLVSSSTDPKLDSWKNLIKDYNGLPRALVKRAVMTLPYGVTMHSCREYIHDWIALEAPRSLAGAFSYVQATTLAPLLWKAMGEVVIAAREAMDWIQGVAIQAADRNLPLSWYSPVGFPVVQDRRRTIIKRVRTEVLGEIQLAVRFEEANPDRIKQKLACAPNFIHSMDAAHAMLTIIAARKEGMTNFMFIHDDFGTLAADTDAFFQIIREEFVRMYSESKPLEEFKRTIELDTGLVLTDPPKEGSLTISEVLESLYFFS